MVILDDFHKSLLLKRFNLGYDCVVCSKRFYSKHEQLKHTQECHSEKTEKLTCPKCRKSFGHHQILQLHMQIHALSDPPTAIPPVQKEIALGRNEVEKTKPVPKPANKGATSQEKIGKKQIGLTKIKMEDCLRCDACSCIYIDAKDYHKHMRNFHQINTSTSSKQAKAKQKCRSCCKHCRGSHCEPVKRARSTQASSNLIFKYTMRDNIKDRWSKMVSNRLSEIETPESTETAVEIKQEPEDPADLPLDFSHLLSQVEVKIKTEPLNDYN